MKLEANDIADLKPIIDHVVRTVMNEIRVDEAKLGDRIGYSESEAASLLGVARHVLADARRRGEIKAKKVGKEFRYLRSQLVAYLES